MISVTQPFDREVVEHYELVDAQTFVVRRPPSQPDLEPDRPSRARAAHARFDLATLIAAVGAHRYLVETGNGLERVAPIAHLVATLGVQAATIQRWALDGIPYWQADRAACAFGRHPVTVWPDWYEHTPRTTV